MTKHRLNIKFKYPEDKKDFHLVKRWIDNDGKKCTLKDGYYMFDNGDSFSTDSRAVKWIEEIKHSEFEEWFCKNIGHATPFGTYLDCWQASEKNTHLLYKEFASYYRDFDNELVRMKTLPHLPSLDKLVTSFEKIKQQISGNND